MWRPLQLLKKWENSKRGIITGSIGCQNSPICHVKVCYEYISQASPPIDYPTKNCSRQQQGDKFFSLFVYITCYFVIDHLNVIGWLNVDHSVFQKEELWLALIYVCSNCIPFYIIYVSLMLDFLFQYGMIHLLTYMGVFDLAFVSKYRQICWIKPDNWHLGRKRGIWASIIAGFDYGS